MNAPVSWGKLFTFRDRPGEPLLEKCERIKAELAECQAKAREPQAVIDFTEPRRDDDGAL